jgi:hypothetical protein
VLIPAYLPKSFVRENAGKNRRCWSHGEPMVQIIYETRGGEILTFNEWLPQRLLRRKVGHTASVSVHRRGLQSGRTGMKIGSLRDSQGVVPNMITAEKPVLS